MKVSEMTFEAAIHATDNDVAWATIQICNRDGKTVSQVSRIEARIYFAKRMIEACARE